MVIYVHNTHLNPWTLIQFAIIFSNFGWWIVLHQVFTKEIRWCPVIYFCCYLGHVTIRGFHNQAFWKNKSPDERITWTDSRKWNMLEIPGILQPRYCIPRCGLLLADVHCLDGVACGTFTWRHLCVGMDGGNWFCQETWSIRQDNQGDEASFCGLQGIQMHRTIKVNIEVHSSETQMTFFLLHRSQIETSA